MTVPSTEQGDTAHGLWELAAGLSDSARRSEASTQLARAMGSDHLVVFMRDAEIGVLLPAPGFPQTLADGAAWREFLIDCVERGRARGRLRLTQGAPVQHALGQAWDREVALVLLAPAPPTADLSWTRGLLPLLAAVFRGERAAVHAHAQARLAAESSARAARLVHMLDAARRELELALRRARTTGVELERANARLAAQARELEAANEHLRHQALQLEEQAMELEVQKEDLQHVNDTLEKARLAAEAASRAKSDFLAMMSHELRTPLNAIAGHTQLLDMGLHGPLTDAQRETLGRIDRSQRHLLGLINDVLNLARIESGRVEYRMEDVSLREAIDLVAPMIAPQCEAKALALSLPAERELPTVRADGDKLQQILLNLLSNAVKFTPPQGRIWVEAVSLSAESATRGDMTAARADPARVAIRVGDTGRGVPPEKRDYIFEPFTQVDASHSRPEQGSGLGLAISRDLARGMGGDLTVESEVGRGSLFTLTLLAASPPHRASS